MYVLIPIYEIQVLKYSNSKYSQKRLNHLNIKFRDEVILFNVLTDSIYLEVLKHFL